MTNRIDRPVRTAWLLACVFASGAGAVHAASVPTSEAEDQCTHKPCAAPEKPSAGNFVFGAQDRDLGKQLKDAAPVLPDLAWDKSAAGNKGMPRSHGAAGGLLGHKPDVIHTGAGKDIVPGQKVVPDPQTPGYPPAPTAVPLPAALWLLLSGMVALGWGARRRGRG